MLIAARVFGKCVILQNIPSENVEKIKIFAHKMCDPEIGAFQVIINGNRARLS